MRINIGCDHHGWTLDSTGDPLSPRVRSRWDLVSMGWHWVTRVSASYVRPQGFAENLNTDS